MNIEQKLMYTVSYTNNYLCSDSTQIQCHITYVGIAIVVGLERTTEKSGNMTDIAENVIFMSVSCRF